MKTMTCKQLGGSCATPFHANTADDVIKAQDKLSLYVNVGDRTTFEVEFSLDELKEGLF